MHSLGQKLEEARKQQGLSLREAADATKIRSDILLKFENNNMDFDLPDVYKRGFLRLYAKLLKLDTTDIMKDYHELVVQQGATERPRISEKTLKRELFGQISIDDEPEAEAEPDTVEASATYGASRNFPWRIVIVGAFACLALIGAFWAFKNDEKTAPATAYGAHLEAVSSGSKALDQVVELVASGDVYVVVRQESDRQKLFVGALKKGERVTITKNGPIKIQHTQGENLFLEKNGQRYAMTGKGLAVSQFD